MFLIIFWLGAATTVTAIGIDSDWKFELNGIKLYKGLSANDIVGKNIFKLISNVQIEEVIKIINKVTPLVRP